MSNVARQKRLVSLPTSPQPESHEMDDPALEESLEQILSRFETTEQREIAIVKLWQSLNEAVRDW